MDCQIQKTLRDRKNHYIRCEFNKNHYLLTGWKPLRIGKRGATGCDFKRVRLRKFGARCAKHQPQRSRVERRTAGLSMTLEQSHALRLPPLTFTHTQRNKHQSLLKIADNDPDQQISAALSSLVSSSFLIFGLWLWRERVWPEPPPPQRGPAPSPGATQFRRRVRRGGETCRCHRERTRRQQANDLDDCRFV